MGRGGSHVSRARTAPGRHRRWLGAALAGCVLLALHGFVVEPRWVLLRDRVDLPLTAPAFRVAHLSDLHVAGDRLLLRRLERRIAAEEPQLILVSGDLIADSRTEAGHLRNAEGAAQLIRRLRAIAPVMAVQGHSDYRGGVVGLLAAAGVEWLSNEGRAIGPNQSVLLLGLNQQVGFDALVPSPDPRFMPLEAAGGGFGKSLPGPGRINFYTSYDPQPQPLEDAGGPFVWSGYEVEVETWVDGPATGAGIAAHSRYALGEHRMIRLARAGRGGPFALVVDGSGPVEGQPVTGVVPESGRWFRLRLRTEVGEDRVRALARAWPADQPEPRSWQAWIEDRSATRTTAGTVSLWAWGDGTVAYRRLVVRGLDGDPLLAAPLDRERPAGWVDGARSTRLELALARSPPAARGLPRVVLTHDPAAAREAVEAGAALVLAGHTHGGQVRIPGLGAPLTRTALGRRFDRGLFALPGSAAGSSGSLYVNPGVGTAFVPVRLFSPPAYAVVELGSLPR